MVKIDFAKNVMDGIKNLKIDRDVHRKLDVDIYKFGIDYFPVLNIRGIKHLLEILDGFRGLCPFDDKNILDSVTDVIPEKYEGGLKIWEGCMDLIAYLMELNLNLKSFNVFDAGCGAGMLGIYALRKGAKRVYFSDFNREVLDWVTTPNVIMNATFTSQTEHALCYNSAVRCRYIDSDWYIVNVHMGMTMQFDLILSSETLYEKKYYPNFLKLLKERLKRTGQILIATKVYYFGNEGSLAEFEEYVENDKTFKLEVVKTIESSVPRKIIKLTFKNKPTKRQIEVYEQGLNEQELSDNDEPPQFKGLPPYDPELFDNIKNYEKYFANREEVDLHKDLLKLCREDEIVGNKIEEEEEEEEEEKQTGCFNLKNCRKKK